MLPYESRFLLLFVVGLLIVGEQLGKCEIVGENVCREERRARVNVTEYYIQNITVRDYKWCVNVPPRCSFYTIRPVIIPRLVERERLDVVETCCPGFTNKENHCYKNNDTKCEHGAYVAQNDSCLCFSGWKGHSCESLCDEGYYGEGCLQKCDCPFCNSTNGECYTTTTTTESAIRTFGPPRLQKYHTFDGTATTEQLVVITETPTQATETSSSSYQHEALTTKHIPIPQIQKQHSDQFVFGVATAIGGGLIVLALCVVLVVVRRFQKMVGVAEKRSTIRVKSNRERASSNDATYQENSSYRTSLPLNTLPETNPAGCCECNTTIKNNHDFYFYDYPPSSGSYRAASIPEPADEGLKINSTLTVDHVYDEIPAQKCVQGSFCVHFNQSAVYANEASSSVAFNKTDTCKHCFT